MTTLNGERDVNLCHWRMPEQCPNKACWQVVSRDHEAARVCHGHLLDTCQTWASMAPLKVDPIFMGWRESVMPAV